MDEFPPNSHKAKGEKREKVTRVTSGDAVRRRKPLGRQFKETFVGGDARSATQYVIFDVVIPSVRDMLYDAFTEGMHRMIFGEGNRRRSSSYRPGGPLGHIDYSSSYRKPPSSRQDYPPEPRRMSRRARSNHDFGEIILTSRAEAEAVIDALHEMASKFDTVSVADLYATVGLESNHTDYDWGWHTLQGSDVMKVRGGYLLDLPEPQPFK